MTLIESTSEQLIKDFSIFVADDKTTKYFAGKCALVHLEKLRKFYSINSLKTDMIEKQIKYIKNNL